MKSVKIVAFFSVLICFLMMLSGCSLLSTGDELLSAPQAGGEVSKIQAALNELVTVDYTLKYPTSGEYRSAIVRYDITGDGREEAIAFFSTEAENITQMHVAVLTEKEGKWQAAKDASTLASGVERVEFCDLNGDGKHEIMVGWSILGNVDKQVSVYTFDGSVLLPRAAEKYNEFICCDLDTDGKNELLVFHVNSTEGTARARMLELRPDGINEKASAVTDGGVSSYFGIRVGKLLDGREAIFLDGKKGAGSITEIIYLSGGVLVNPLYSAEEAKTQTERVFTDAVYDMGGDGFIDIPMHVVAPGYENVESGREYITKWCAYNGRSLVVTATTISDIQDGYFMTVPKSHEGKITFVTSADGRVKTVSRYSAEEEAIKEVLFKLKEIPKEEYVEDEDYTVVAETDSLVIAVWISDYAGEEALSLREITEAVKIFEKGTSK